MMPADFEVAHGYTIRDLDRLARIAVRMAYLRSLPAQDRYESAWSAIGLALAAATEAPTECDLKAVGMRAINDLHHVEDHHHGVTRSRADLGDASMPRYHAYWALARVTPSFEDQVVDRVALGQIWPVLSPMQAAALTAFAERGTHDAATAAIGVAPGTYKVHIMRGRDKVLALWHEGEAPSRLWSKSLSSEATGKPTRVLAQRRRARRERSGVAA